MRNRGKAKGQPDTGHVQPPTNRRPGHAVTARRASTSCTSSILLLRWRVLNKSLLCCRFFTAAPFVLNQGGRL
jgi:hypothetical protein